MTQKNAANDRAMTMAHLGATKKWFKKKKLHNFVNEAGISEGNKSLTTSRMVDLRCKVGRVSLRRAMKSMGVKASNLKRESEHKLPLPTVMSSMLSANAKAKLHVFEDHWS